MGSHGRAGSLALALVFVVVASTTAASAENVAAYRGFRLGMTLSEVASAAAVPGADVKVIVERPLLIQELRWSPPTRPGTDGAPPQRDSVTQVLFGFCNGTLYRMVVNYDPEQTEGMTDQDLIDALSATYGLARTPALAATVITSPASQSYVDDQPVTARWEDASAAVILFHGTYRSTFGLVIVDKAQAAAARAGVVTGLRLAQLDAPRRELEEQKLRDETERLTRAKARAVNKVAFRY